ncbi:MAG: hypothetical protein IT259_06165 [Saprospiraceae bacterium]|nr:hypothetical protein [Saprospiraceae bacterium]
MKKIILTLCIALLGLGALPSLSAQCTTSAGTIQSFAATVCGEGSILAILNNDAVLDGDDVRQLVVFTGADPLSGTILAVSPPGMLPTVSLPFDPLFAANSPVHIAPIAGNNNGSGGVDLGDPCLSVGPIQTVTYRELPQVDVLPDNAVLTCANPIVQLVAASPDPGVTFSWGGSPGGWVFTGAVATVTAPGQYCVVVTNQFGCTAQECVIVTQDVSFPQITISGAPDPISCDNPSTTLPGVVTFPSQGFTVEWTGPGGFVSSELNPEVNVPGNYILKVTDTLNQCFNSIAVQVESEIEAGIGVGTVECGDTIFLGVLPPPGFVPPLSYLWDNGSTANVYPVTSNPTQDICITITDATGCSTIACLPALTIVVGPVLSVNWEPELVNCDEQVWFAHPSGGTPPYLYMASFNGVPFTPNGNWVTATESGLYSMTVVDASGCSVTLDTFLEVNADLCAFIRGRVFRDSDENCLYTASEPGLANWIVTATDGNSTFYGVTDTAGFYDISVFPGTYSVSLSVPDTAIWMPCAATLGTGALAIGDTATADFPVNPLVDCPLMRVSIATPLLRRCFDNNYYTVSWCNEGTITAEDAYVDVALDPLLELINGPVPYNSLGNNVFRFPLANVAPGDCGAFQLQVEVSCDAVLGQVHCTEAHIYPDTLCTEIDNWQGASVEVMAECDQDSVKFSIRNVGTADMSVPLEYVVIEDAIMYLDINAPPLNVGAQYEIGFPANGATWRLIANQEPFHPTYPATPTAWVEGCVTGGGPFSTGFVLMFPDGDASPWLDINCTANVGSFDPNDKQGFPTGYGQAHYIKPGTPLEYLIRFQNTGTDTAFTVVIRDTLSAFLDPTTIEPGASSHPYRFELYGEGIVKFTFEDILLPDSNVNEPASHGFVQFGIRHYPDVPLESDIYNSAGIYFDYNLPMITNTTWHRIGENFTVIGWRPAQPGIDLLIAPHPMNNEARIEITGLPLGSPLTMRLFDINGRLVRQESTTAPAFALRRNGLPGGVYLLEIRSPEGLAGYAKVVVAE